MSEHPGINFGGFEGGQPEKTPEQVRDQRLVRLLTKAATFGRGLQMAPGGDVLENRSKAHHASLAGAYRVIAKAQELSEGRNSGLTERLRNFIDEADPGPKLNQTMDAVFAYLFGDADRSKFDVVDVAVGLKYALSALDRNLAIKLDRGTDSDRGRRWSTWDAGKDALVTKFVDQISMQHYFDFDNRAELDTLLTAAFDDPNALDEPVKNRILRANEDRMWLHSIAYALKDIRLGKDSQKINQAYVRFVENLGKQNELGGFRTPELIIDGAALGMKWDLRMYHPDSLLDEESGIGHEQVLCEFHVLQPLPEGETVRRQVVVDAIVGKYYKLSNDDINLAFRLFRDGRIDFGARLYGYSYRRIDNPVMDIGGRDALLYMKLVLAALVVDATAPTELYEKEHVQSLPEVIGEALAKGESLGDVMRRKVIPRRAAILRELQEERDRQGDGTGKQLNPHLIRGYAMQLRPGFKRSQKNLDKYLDHKEQGWVVLTEEEEEAIISGEKCYIPPRMHGRRIGGPAVRAVLGDGTTAQIVQAAVEGMETASVSSETEPSEEVPLPRINESKVATRSLLKRLLAKMKRRKTP